MTYIMTQDSLSHYLFFFPTRCVLPSSSLLRRSVITRHTVWLYHVAWRCALSSIMLPIPPLLSHSCLDSIIIRRGLIATTGPSVAKQDDGRIWNVMLTRELKDIFGYDYGDGRLIAMTMKEVRRKFYAAIAILLLRFASSTVWLRLDDEMIALPTYLTACHILPKGMKEVGIRAL